jgi:hypothetical protein
VFRALRLVSVLLLASVAAHAQAEPVAKTTKAALASGFAVQGSLKQALRVGDELRSAGQKPVWNKNGGVEMHNAGEHYFETWRHSAHGSVGYVTTYNEKKRVEHTITLTLDDLGHLLGASSIASRFDPAGQKDTHHVLVEHVGKDGHVMRSAHLSTGEQPTRQLGKQSQGEGGVADEARLSSTPLDARGFDGHNRLIQHLKFDAPTNGAAPRDVALGTERTSGRTTLDQFGVTVGASIYRAWGARGLATHGSAAVAEFAERFHDAMKSSIARGGRIKYDLTGIDVARAKATVGDAVPSKGITAWELRQVLSHPEYLAVTDFYVQGKSGAYQKLGANELHALGIE